MPKSNKLLLFWNGCSPTSAIILIRSLFLNVLIVPNLKLLWLFSGLGKVKSCNFDGISISGGGKLDVAVPNPSIVISPLPPSVDDKIVLPPPTKLVGTPPLN